MSGLSSILFHYFSKWFRFMVWYPFSIVMKIFWAGIVDIIYVNINFGIVAILVWNLGLYKTLAVPRANCLDATLHWCSNLNKRSPDQALHKWLRESYFPGCWHLGIVKPCFWLVLCNILFSWILSHKHQDQNKTDLKYFTLYEMNQ